MFHVVLNIEKVFYIMVQLAIGYTATFILCFLLSIPNKKTLGYKEDKTEAIRVKSELKKAKILGCVVWSVIIAAMNFILWLIQKI